MPPRVGTALRLLAVGGTGLFAGLLSLGCRGVVVTHEYPLPHHVPKYPGGISLRFAMVHDAIHERYPRHGAAYYEERNRLARAGIREEGAKQSADGKPSERYYALTDDLAVGLERRGDIAGAVELMRKKLARQEAAGLSGRALYTTYANLGTFLIHQQMAVGIADRAAKKRLREGLDFVRKSIAVNPEAHFGREEWQANAVEYLLAALDDPGLVSRYDLAGDKLAEEIDPAAARRIRYGGLWVHTDHARSARRHLDHPETPLGKEEVEGIRNHIATVGAEEEWASALKAPERMPFPFDEPCLGILGMWRYGGGANPYFAVTLGEIMLRVGQRYIAWDAYERAAGLADRLGNKDTAAKFVAHCRTRQRAIEETLPADEVAKLRPVFDEELAFGRGYQEGYQAYEADRIRAGASLDDPHFYDAFDAEHGSVASPVGPEDRYVTERTERWFGQSGLPLFATAALPRAALTAGIVAFTVACVVRIRAWFREAASHPASPQPPSGTMA